MVFVVIEVWLYHHLFAKILIILYFFILCLYLSCEFCWCLPHIPSFPIHPDILCLLMDEFNLLVFREVIDIKRYVTFFSWVFFVCLFFTSSHFFLQELFHWFLQSWFSCYKCFQLLFTCELFDPSLKYIWKFLGYIH